MSDPERKNPFEGFRVQIDPDKIKPWLMKVTRNTCLDRLRRRRDEVEFQDYGATVEGTPADDLERSELGRWLEQKIGALREPYRTLEILRDIYQHSYDEVANATELSLSQVKVYLHRARKQLREQLAEVRP